MGPERVQEARPRTRRVGTKREGARTSQRVHEAREPKDRAWKEGEKNKEGYRGIRRT